MHSKTSEDSNKRSDRLWQLSYHRTCTKKHAFWKYLKPVHDKLQAFNRFWQSRQVYL